MTDSKMPERIWAGDYNDTDGGGYWWHDPSANTGLVEYIRADLAHPAPVADAELEALIPDEIEFYRAFKRATNRRHMTLARVVVEMLKPVDAALRARTAQPVGVRVKPLEWIRADLSAWGENASAGLIRYNLTWTYRDNPEVWLKVVRYPDCKVIYEGGDEDKAYGAAQADYEQRILSALLPEGGA